MRVPGDGPLPNEGPSANVPVGVVSVPCRRWPGAAKPLSPMRAGIGPATAFLYSGPAINVLAMILTARVLGLQIGLARAIGAVAFAVVIGLIMAAIFRKEEAERVKNGPDPFAAAGAAASGRTRQGWQDASFLGSMIAVLVFANWGASNRAVGFNG